MIRENGLSLFSRIGLLLTNSKYQKSRYGISLLGHQKPLSYSPKIDIYQPIFNSVDHQTSDIFGACFLEQISFVSIYGSLTYK